MMLVLKKLLYVKCVTVLSSSASDFGYCDVSLLPFIKKKVNHIDDFLYFQFKLP